MRVLPRLLCLLPPQSHWGILLFLFVYYSRISCGYSLAIFVYYRPNRIGASPCFSLFIIPASHAVPRPSLLISLQSHWSIPCTRLCPLLPHLMRHLAPLCLLVPNLIGVLGSTIFHRLE